MNLNVHVYHHFNDDRCGGVTHHDVERIECLLRALKQQGVSIMTTQEETAAELTRLTEQVTKTRAELQAKLDELAQAIVNAGNSTPEVDAALAGLRAAVQSQDDMVPDAPTE